MAKQELFENLKTYRCSLQKEERDNAVKLLVKKAKLKAQYFYSLKETCAILHCSKAELQTIIHQYRLDVVLFSGVYRVPWYDLSGFILDDPEDTLQEDLNEYIRILIRNREFIKNTGCNHRPIAKLSCNTNN